MPGYRGRKATGNHHWYGARCSLFPAGFALLVSLPDARMNGKVLVLNQNYEPLNICVWQRAISLIYVGKAVVLENDSQMLHSPSVTMRMPSVIRIARHIKRPLPEVKLSRQSLMARDQRTCQYCGKKTKYLTVDHVIPRERGGVHDWGNVVACCDECNNRKRNRTPHEAEMSLISRPTRPRFIPYLSFAAMREALCDEVWRDYLEPFAPHLVPD